MDKFPIKTDDKSYLPFPSDFEARNKEEFDLIQYFNETGNDWYDISSGNITGYSKNLDGFPMVKTWCLFDYPFDVVLEAMKDEEIRKKINGEKEGPDNLYLDKTQIDDKTTQTIRRVTFSIPVPFMYPREMLLKVLFISPYSKDDFLSYSTNTEHKDYPLDTKKYVRCNVHYLATYARKEGEKTKIYRLSHFNMEISMMNKFAGGSAAIKKTNEFLEGLKKGCEEVLERRKNAK